MLGLIYLLKVYAEVLLPTRNRSVSSSMCGPRTLVKYPCFSTLFLPFLHHTFVLTKTPIKLVSQACKYQLSNMQKEPNLNKQNSMFINL